MLATVKGVTMDLLVEREDIWAASVDDRPGALATTLSELADAGADLDSVVARRSPEKPGTGVVFVTPLRGDHEVQRAAALGFTVTSRTHSRHYSVRVEGADEPGIAAKLTKAIGGAGINMRGLSAAIIGTRFVMHIAVDSAEDEHAVVKLLSEL
jgi:predicted amino acid-binding ACT domain protein